MCGAVASRGRANAASTPRSDGAQVRRARPKPPGRHLYIGIVKAVA